MKELNKEELAALATKLNSQSDPMFKSEGNVKLIRKEADYMNPGGPVETDEDLELIAVWSPKDPNKHKHLRS